MLRWPIEIYYKIWEVLCMTEKTLKEKIEHLNRHMPGKFIIDMHELHRERMRERLEEG